MNTRTILTILRAIFVYFKQPISCPRLQAAKILTDPRSAHLVKIADRYSVGVCPVIRLNTLAK